MTKLRTIGLGLFLSALVVFGGALIAQKDFNLGASDIEKMQSFQDKYYQEHGRYFQILPNKKLPHYANDHMKDFAREHLPSDVPSGMIVDIYEYPDGTHGYEIRYEGEPQSEVTATST